VLKLKKIILLTALIFLLSIFSCMSLAQPSSLSDRELLIQLHSKLEFIEESVKRIEENFSDVNRKVILLDKQVTKNELNRIFVWMWRRSYNGRNNKLVQNSK